MKFRMDKIIRELVEESWEWARLGRDRDFLDQDAVFAETLADLESDGNAMRYVDSKGRIAWKATPDLRDYLKDLRVDAEADLEDEEV
jgi:hypothetical protein